MGPVDAEVVEQPDAVCGHVRQGVRHGREWLTLQDRCQNGAGRDMLSVKFGRQPDVTVVELDDEQTLCHQLLDVSPLPRDELTRVPVDDQEWRIR